MSKQEWNKTETEMDESTVISGSLDAQNQVNTYTQMIPAQGLPGGIQRYIPGLEVTKTGTMLKDGQVVYGNTEDKLRNEWVCLSVLSESDNKLHKLLDQLTHWAQWPMPLGLLMAYRSQEENRECQKYLHSGKNLMTSRTWPTIAENDAYHLYTTLPLYANEQADCHYYLLCVVDGYEYPELFGHWPIIIQKALQEVSKVPAQVQTANLKRYFAMTGHNHIRHLADIRPDSYVLNSRIISVLYAWLSDREDVLEAAGAVNDEMDITLMIVSRVLFVWNCHYTKVQFYSFLRHKASRQIDEKMCKLAAYVKTTSIPVTLDREWVIGLAACPEALKLFFEYGKKKSGITRTGIMEYIMSQNLTASFARLLELGFVNTRTIASRLQKAAEEQGKTEFNALILDYIHQKWDPKKEQERQEKKEMALLNAKPDSALLMKDLYTWKKLDDGTLMIVTFKGEYKEEIVVPAKIGRNKVSRIGPRAFDPYKSRGKYKERPTYPLKRIIVSEGIEVIDQKAFGSCIRLRRIDLPESLVWIASDAFEDSGSVELFTPAKHFWVKAVPDDEKDLEFYCIPEIWFSKRKNWIHMPKDNLGYTMYIDTDTANQVIGDYEDAR